MAEAKTKQTDVPVSDFLEGIADEQVRDDCREISKLMKKVTGSAPKMWGPAIVGFGKYHYKYESGHEGDACLTGFSPRKANITVYVMGDFKDKESLLKKLGKHKATVGCIYIKKLEDIDMGVLEKIIKGSVEYIKKKYPDK